MCVRWHRPIRLFVMVSNNMQLDKRSVTHLKFINDL